MLCRSDTYRISLRSICYVSSRRPSPLSQRSSGGVSVMNVEEGETHGEAGATYDGLTAKRIAFHQAALSSSREGTLGETTSGMAVAERGTAAERPSLVVAG